MRIRDRVTEASVVAAVALSIFAVGGVLRWTQAAVAVIVAIGVGCTVLSRRSLGRWSPLVLMLMTATLLTLIQIIPLPAAVTEALSPTASALRADGSEILGVTPSSTISTDVGATISSAVMLATLLGLALLVLRLSISERGRYRIISTVAALCGAASIITWLHRLLGLRALYGFYKPEYADPGMLGPLLNSNSLGCLMAMGAVLSMGLAAHPRQRSWVRATWLLVVVACGAAAVATVSRGATLALFGGSLVTIGILLAQRFVVVDRSRRRRLRFFSSALPMAVLAGCLIILVIYSSAGNVERQLSQLSFDEVHQSRSKFAAWRSSTQLIEEAPWLGNGRGAFEASFTRVHGASGFATYAYLENEYLQAVVDWGIPGALALGFCALWLAYVCIRRWRDGPLIAGALGALAVVAMQSNVDFGLEFLGLAAPVTAIAATVAYVPLRDSERLVTARGLRVVHVLGLLVGAVLLLTSITTPLDEDRQVLATSASMDRIRASVERHPLDYYAYAVGADVLARRNDPRAIRLLNHAMELHPSHPQLHRMAGRMLKAKGFVSQAAIEYALAVQSSSDPRPLIAEILANLPPEEAAAALPLDFRYPEVLVRILDDSGRPDVARMWLSRILELRPKMTRVCDLMYTIALAGDMKAAEIAGRRCTDRLPDYETRLSLARLLISKENAAEAIRLLQDVESWQARREDKTDAWLVLCDAQRSLGYIDEAKRCLHRLDASPDMVPERRGEILHRLDDMANGRLTGSAAAP